MRRGFLIFVSFFFLVRAEAALLDKMMAVFNDKIITLSQVKRVYKNLEARKNISPSVYNEVKLKNPEIISLIINRHLIREKLAETGYIISNEQVESQIKSTEKRLKLNRTALLQFLSGNHMTFDEYFEIIRETIEYNIFYSRIIKPLISITEQEIKNYYYKKNINNKTIAFRYNLIDFSMPASNMTSKMKKGFKQTLKKFQTNGILPDQYSDLQTHELGDITEDGLTKKLKSLLKKTEEGKFSDSIKIGNDFHVFFIKRKDLVASEKYKLERRKIKEKLFNISAKKIVKLWLKREQNKHYIKIF